MNNTPMSQRDAPAWLQLSADRPESVFARDPQVAKQQWRQLAAKWHPDRCRDERASWVFNHIQRLYQSAREKHQGGIWAAPGELYVSSDDGKCFRVRYCNRLALDIGEAFVGREIIAFTFRAEHSDLAARGHQQALDLAYVDERVRDEISRFMPRPVALLSTRAGPVLVLRKSSEFLPLGLVLAAQGATMPPEHVAWIVSSLLNICCYLESIDLAHQAIAIDNCLVSPTNHAIALIGGWWYAATCGSSLHALPERSVKLLAPDALAARLVDHRLDRTLVRATALELLGIDTTHMPAKFLDFLTLPPADTAIEDYSRWQTVLWESFGERRFQTFTVNPNDIYTMST